jgi:PAS domain S-box
MTERTNRTAAAEVEAEERYRAFIAHSTEGIWRFDLEEPVAVDLPEEEQVEAFYRFGYLAEANDAFARMYGFARGEEMVGARLGDLLVRDDPANALYLRAFIRCNYRLADAPSVETDRHGNLRHFSNTLTGIVEEGRLVRAWGTQRDITQQKKADQERERVLVQMAAVLETARDGIIVSDPAGNSLMWNPAALALHGFSHSEEAQRHVSEFVNTFVVYPSHNGERRAGRSADEPLPPSDWPLARLVRGETFSDLELRFRRLDTGMERWVSYSGAVARGADGAPLLLVLTVRDVSEQVQATEALRASEARYRRLLDTAMEGILFLDRRAVITRINRRFARMLGYDAPEELVGQSVFQLFFPEDQEQARRKWGRRLAGEAEEYELRLRRKDGSECWVIGHISVETDGESGAVVGTFSMVTDITERRRAMEALRAKSDEVNAILESIGDAFFAVDESWRFTYVNAEAERLLARERGELLGQSLWEKFPAAIGTEFESQYRRVMQARVTSSFQAYYPTPLDSWYEVRAYPSPAGGGLSVYFRNISRERREQQERDRLLAEQERLVAELREAGGRQRRFLKEMLAGFTEGRLRLCFSEDELPAPLPPLSERWALSQTSLRWLRQELEERAAGWGLPEERRQDFATAVHEAAVNAMKYGGGGTARIHGNDSTLQVWIVDEGPGIAEDMIHRAIERGYTTQGFGLGMFFMQSLTDRLYLFSEAGKGTTVVLEMDRTPPGPAWL